MPGRNSEPIEWGENKEIHDNSVVCLQHSAGRAGVNSFIPRRQGHGARTPSMKHACTCSLPDASKRSRAPIPRWHAGRAHVPERAEFCGIATQIAATPWVQKTLGGHRRRENRRRRGKGEIHPLLGMSWARGGVVCPGSSSFTPGLNEAFSSVYWAFCG